MNNYEKLLYKSKRQKRQLSILGHKINLYKKQLEAYENMRKEANNFVMQPNIEIREYRSCDMDYEIVNCNLLNILNKVGGNDE